MTHIVNTKILQSLLNVKRISPLKLPSTLLAERVKKLKDDYELQGHGG